MQPKRNDPCPCGSGKKYKVCCANKRTPSQWLALASVLIFGLLAAWAVGAAILQKPEADPSAPAAQVWSEEHRHWHPAPGTAGSGPPLGPAPPGKEWSFEHGHWHDAAVPGLGRPPGPVPDGKVWNDEHGHWHDAEGATPAEEFQPPAAQELDASTEFSEEDVSYSEELP